MPSLHLAVSIGLLAAASAASAQTRTATPRESLPWPPVATFSILAMDPATGEIGGAVQSRVFSVGNGVLWAEAGVGAAATQAIVDVSYGPQALVLLRQGLGAEAVVKQIWAQDPDPASDGLDKRGPAVRGDRRQGQRLRVHGAQGYGMGGQQVVWCTDRKSVV